MARTTSPIAIVSMSDHLAEIRNDVSRWKSLSRYDRDTVAWLGSRSKLS
jgi:hypothetical protein